MRQPVGTYLLERYYYSPVTPHTLRSRVVIVYWYILVLVRAHILLTNIFKIIRYVRDTCVYLCSYLFSYDPHIHVCAPLTTLAHRPIVQFKLRLPCFLVIIRTRSRASGTIPCVRTHGVCCKQDRGPLHAVYHAAYISIVAKYSNDALGGTTTIKMWAF